MIKHLSVSTNGQGLYEITDLVNDALMAADMSDGLCVVFLRHTSASLIIQENADPSARKDLEKWLNRLVPERDSLFSHTAEGPDDMPAHIKTALTNSSLSIPVENGALTLGTWQGIYLWEHRHDPHKRKVVVSFTE